MCAISVGKPNCGLQTIFPNFHSVHRFTLMTIKLINFQQYNFNLIFIIVAISSMIPRCLFGSVCALEWLSRVAAMDFSCMESVRVFNTILSSRKLQMVSTQAHSMRIISKSICRTCVFDVCYIECKRLYFMVWRQNVIALVYI